MLTEQRLIALENRTNDALSLAAVAAQHSQSRGVAGMALNTASNVIMMPIKMVWNVCMLPAALVEDLYGRVKTLLLGPVPVQSSKRGSLRSSSNEKLAFKSSGRRLVR